MNYHTKITSVGLQYLLFMRKYEQTCCFSMHIYLGKPYLVLATEKTYALHINYRKLNLGHDGVDKEAQTNFCRSRDRGLLLVCVTQGTTCLLASIYRKLVLTREMRVSILEYSWHAVNIFTCILLLVHSLCTQQ